jgi:hypothetical protein
LQYAAAVVVPLIAYVEHVIEQLYTHLSVLRAVQQRVLLVLNRSCIGRCRRWSCV